MIEQTKYLIIGGGHAGLEALEAIRVADPGAVVTLVNRDAVMYTPTALPYIVSGEADPESIRLCDDKHFARNWVRLLLGTLCRLDPDRCMATLETGARVRYEKVLLATGAAPVVPPLDAATRARVHVLRTLKDAESLKAAAVRARRALILGAGLIGMQIAEILALRGVEVTVVEMRPQILPHYFNAEAASLIEEEFTANGVIVLAGRQAIATSRRLDCCEVTLDNGDRLQSDLLVISEGVRPAMDYLVGTPIARDQGILVDHRMRTNIPNVWAAGDIAQAPCFFFFRPAGAQYVSVGRGAARARRWIEHGRRSGGCALSRQRCAQHVQIFRTIGVVSRRR